MFISKYTIYNIYKKRLKEIGEVIPGMAFRSEDADLLGSIPVINASSIIADSTLNDFSNLLRVKDLPKRSPAIIKNNDILMVSRSVPGNQFKTSLVQTTSPLIATSSLYILRIKDPAISPEYLNFFLNSKAFQQKVIENSRGSTIAYISKRALEEIPIPIPDLDHQKAIINLNQNVRAQNKIIERRQKLREEIIQATFTHLYK